MVKRLTYRSGANALRGGRTSAPAPLAAPPADCVKSIDVEVAKVDDHGVVFGYAIVCKVDGDEYCDVQGDIITEPAMLAAAVEYMQSDRVAKLQHRGSRAGQILFAFPLTTDVMKALDLDGPRTGLLVGMKPDPHMLAKFRSGELTGFSIGGERVEEEVIDG